MGGTIKVSKAKSRPRVSLFPLYKDPNEKLHHHVHLYASVPLVKMVIG